MADDGYLKEAFFLKPNLIGLGAGVVAATLLPFSGPLLLGVAVLEGAYLFSMSKNPRFQRMVRSRRGREKTALDAFPAVDPAVLSRSRLLALRRQERRGRRGVAPGPAADRGRHRPAGRGRPAPRRARRAGRLASRRRATARAAARDRRPAGIR